MPFSCQAQPASSCSPAALPAPAQSPQRASCPAQLCAACCVPFDLLSQLADRVEQCGSSRSCGAPPGRWPSSRQPVSLHRAQVSGRAALAPFLSAAAAHRPALADRHVHQPAAASCLPGPAHRPAGHPGRALAGPGRAEDVLPKTVPVQQARGAGRPAQLTACCSCTARPAHTPPAAGEAHQGVGGQAHGPPQQLPHQVLPGWGPGCSVGSWEPPLRAG